MIKHLVAGLGDWGRLVVWMLRQTILPPPPTPPPQQCPFCRLTKCIPPGDCRTQRDTVRNARFR